jgi:Mrp family chromosome partitioning ATPase
VTKGPDTRNGAPEETRTAAGPEGEALDRGGSKADEQLGPTLTSELVSLNAMLTEALAQLVRERRDATFKPPSAAPPPVGMATDEQVESFRELRTQLMLMAANVGLTHFTTMVVPVTEGSGASFVARNLAAAFTLQQRVALLIDCNFRNATQHDLIGADDDAEGLFEFLGQSRGGAPQVSSIARLIRPTPLPGLHVIPAGRCDSILAGPPREHFSSPPMKALLSRLRDEPCYVFLDGPPVEGSPDARILSDLADFVILVVGYGRTSASAIGRAAALFDRKKFAGVVFNEFAEERPPGRARPGAR